MSSNLAGSAPVLTDEFKETFPLLDTRPAMGVFVVSTTDDQDALFFSTNNVIMNESDPNYRVLQQAFGFWTCRLNNSLGTAEATTFITDMCT